VEHARWTLEAGSLYADRSAVHTPGVSRAAFGCVLCAAAAAGSSAADVRPAGVFGHDMLFQRDVPIPVWGWADPGEAVSVEIGPRRASTTAAADGRWEVVLPGLPAPGPYVLTVQSRNRVRYDNLAAGDLWLACGDHAMQTPLHAVPEAAAAIESASHPDVRFFVCERAPLADGPRADALGSWIVSRPETVKDLSAAAYSFACELREAARVPIGVVVATWGRSTCESWVRCSTLADSDVLAGLIATRASDRAAGAPIHASHAGSLFDALVAPLVELPFRGAIFWQGEANVGRAEEYASLLPALIRDWRAAFAREDLDFVFAQLPARGLADALDAAPGDTSWGELRTAQAAALALPHTSMVVALDVSLDELAERRCLAVGARLARSARQLELAEPRSAPGSALAACERRGGELALTFAPGTAPRTGDGGAPRGFAVAGSDGVWRWASARIEGDVILLSHPDVPEPREARFGWWAGPPTNVFDAAGEPLGPLRTDDWPLDEETRAGGG
jgi:sialate O-acetylesterase